MKKNYIKINDQGYWVEDVPIGPGERIRDLATIKDEDGNLLPEYIDPTEKPISQGIHLPKWNGSEWIEGKSSSLDEERINAVEKVKSITKQLIENGILFKGHSFLLRKFPEQLNLNTTFNNLNLNQETIYLNKRIPWNTKEGLVVQMSVTTFKRFYVLASNHILDLLANSKEIQIKIKEAESFEEVQHLIKTFKEVQNVSK